MAAEVKVVATYVGASLDKGLKDAQKELANTAVAANKLDSSLSKDFVKGSNSAAFALQNLGRVAQDAPYGFIGIQNNINPLLESFQRLKQESGSTGGALKALASSLVGGAGIGLAVSLVTSALTVLTQKGFFKSTKAAVDNKKAVDDLKSSYDGIIKSLSEESTKVDVIVKQLQSEVLSRKQRVEAINQLQKIAPAYFANLDKENATIGQITTAYDNFSESILKSIRVRVREKELISITEQILKLQDKGADVGEQQVVIDGKLRSVTKARLQTLDESNQKINAYKQLQEGVIGLTLKEQDELKNLLIARQKLIDLVAKDKGVDIFNKVGATEKAKKDAQTIADVLTDLAKQIDFLNKKEIAFNTNETKAKISAYFSTIEKLIKDFKPSKNLIDSLFFDAGDIKIKNALKTIREGIVEAPIEIPVTVGFEFKKSFTPEDIKEQEAIAYLQGVGITKAMQDGINVGIEGLRFPQLIALAKSTEEQIAAITELMRSSFAGAAEQFGMAIGAAIGGSGNFLRDALGGVFSIMGDFLVQLGKAAIITSKLFLAIQASKFNPFAGIIGGIVAIAAGTLLKNIKLPRFATGGTTPGGSILVGERGPEIISAPRGSVITPNAQTNAILGGNGGGRLTGEFVVRGNDLVLALNRATASNRRNGQ